MVRRSALVALAALTVAAAAASRGTATAAPDAHAALLGRAFTVLAEGYPVEPAPGSQSQPIAIRPASARISLANPPATAYARAAAADLGLAEGYFGQQGPSAEVDTAVEDQPYEESVDDDGTRLHAEVTETPSALSTAEIVASGGAATASRAAGALTADRRLTATASSEIRDAAVGPLVIDGARFDAAAATTGQPGGGVGSGIVSVSGASVGGLPVVVDDSGIRIDETQVPAGQVRSATTALQVLLGRGGYTDIRVVQPTVTVAPDGSRVEVSGGGIALYLTNNDPSNRYFLSLRALGGRVLIAVGDDFSVAGTDRPAPAGSGESGSDTGGDPGTTGDTQPSPVSDARPDAGEPIELAYADTSAEARLRGTWSGWPWLLLAAAAAVAGTLATVRTARGRRAADQLLDRYVRG